MTPVHKKLTYLQSKPDFMMSRHSKRGHNPQKPLSVEFNTITKEGTNLNILWGPHDASLEGSKNIQ